MSDNEGEQGPKSTFSTYMAEGDQLFHKGEYSKAAESYSTVRAEGKLFVFRQIYKV